MRACAQIVLLWFVTRRRRQLFHTTVDNTLHPRQKFPQSLLWLGLRRVTRSTLSFHVRTGAFVFYCSLSILNSVGKPGRSKPTPPLHPRAVWRKSRHCQHNEGSYMARYCPDGPCLSVCLLIGCGRGTCILQIVAEECVSYRLLLGNLYLIGCG